MPGWWLPERLAGREHPKKLALGAAGERTGSVVVDGPDRSLADLPVKRFPGRQHHGMPLFAGVAGADDTDERALIHDREMAAARQSRWQSSEHLLHELVDRRVGRAGPDLARHDGGDGIPKNLGTRPATLRTMSHSEMMPAIRPSAAVPHPSVDSHPEPGVPRPRKHPQEAARRPARALQPHTRALRDLRTGPARHRNSLQGIRMDQCRNHEGTGRDDRYNKYDKPKMAYGSAPLRKDWKRTLNK
ncbi:MAG: hypothetical protein OXF56_18075 [Rhodobacteraceae bacterium]|nr:hypothetical protein [Paracoccaceae bacterium]